jgi:phosphoglucosamine mutase
MTLKFGTDGIRGVANLELTPEFVRALGRAAARVLGGGRFVVGRDTRESGPLLQAALSEGLAREAADVADVGVLPTPGVAALSAAYNCPGAVISASHNPYQDNGIKLFTAGGRKLSDHTEAGLEDELRRQLSAGDRGGGATGRIAAAPEAVELYERQLVASVEGRRLEGLRVAIDCANGAAGTTAPAVLAAAGVEIVAILGNEPDGRNINEGCGSTHPEALQDAVVRHRADAGLAFDGDADRVLAVDGNGRLVDGDHVLALCALDLQQRRRLAGDTVVVTVMANLGFRMAMRERGINVYETAVGDRYVLEALDAHGWSLGGEQSGHIIFRDLATTGDGVLTGLQLLDLVVRSRRSLADLAGSAMVRLPQVLRNVRVADKEGLEHAASVWAAVAAVEAELGNSGRVLLRTSGTEPLVRVMVEAPTEVQASSAVDRLCAEVERALG